MIPTLLKSLSDTTKLVQFPAETIATVIVLHFKILFAIFSLVTTKLG